MTGAGRFSRGPQGVGVGSARSSRGPVGRGGRGAWPNAGGRWAGGGGEAGTPSGLATGRPPAPVGDTPWCAGASSHGVTGVEEGLWLEKLEQAIFQLVLHGGNARAKAYEALDAAERFDFEAAERRLAADASHAVQS